MGLRISPLALVFLLACGDDGGGVGGGDGGSAPELTNFDDACDQTAGCRAGRVPSTGVTEPLWRVLVKRSPAGDIRFDRAQLVMVDEGQGAPLGRRRGSHLISLRDALDNVLDAQLIAFPTELQIEVRGETFGAAVSDLSGSEVSTVVFLRAPPEGETLSAEMADGTVVASSPLASVPMSPDDAAEDGAREEGLTQASPHCPHVALLEGDADLDWVPSGQRDGIGFIVPGPVQRATLQGALGLMPRLLCHGFGRIAFGEVTFDPGLGGAVAIRTGDFVLINSIPFSEETVASDERMRIRLLQTIVHEATHATEIMLNDEGMNGSQFGGNWSPEARNIALDTIDHVRLEKSMHSEWLRMHQSFVTLGWANDYPHSIFQFQSEDAATQEVKEWTPEETARGGVMSRYGGQYYADDIAEMVAWSIVGPVAREAGLEEQNNFLEDSACQQARMYMEGNVPSRFASIFTKLNFVRDVGLILPEDYEACVGEGLRLRAETPGMHFWEGGDYQRSFGQGVTAQIGTLRDRTVFEITAGGEASFGEQTYPATGRLVIDLAPAESDIQLVSWPRGVYTLAPLQPHAFELRLEGAAAGNFDVIDGFVLVAESSQDAIAGSVFIRIAMRNQAPLPVPQTFDPPLVVAFRIEN